MTDGAVVVGSTKVRSAVVGAFGALCLAIFIYLWTSSGGHVPGLTGGGYKVALDVPDAGNVVYFSDVEVAGVKVGKVASIKEDGDHAHVVIDLDGDVAPLHQGATVQVRSKSLLEEGFLEVTDGNGPVIASGSELPAGSAKAQVQLADVLNTFDAPTRRSLSTALRSTGLATKDTRAAFQSAVVGLGSMGRRGYTVLDALAAQSADLKQLMRSSTGVLAGLDQRRAQLRSLVADGNAVTRVTAGQQREVRQVVRALPALLDSARNASGPLQSIGRALTPVATNLSAAAPDLTAALRQLPATATSLRNLTPALNTVLDRAPATLSLLPTFGSELQSLIPNANTVLADANPMLAYLAPYNRELDGFFANFADTLSQGDSNGKFLRILTVINAQSYTGNPMTARLGPLVNNDPMPQPGSLGQPSTQYQGSYPHVTAQKK